MENTNVIQAGLKYAYEMTLSLARPGAPLSEEDCLALEQGIAAYNAKSIYMANPKHIRLLETSDSYIRIELSSTQALNTPGRGLRTLTTILMNDSSSRFAERVTAGGQLFRVVDIKQPPRENTEIDPASVSDIDFLKAILDYIMERKDSSTAAQKKRAAIEEMKRLAVESGIIASTEP